MEPQKLKIDWTQRGGECRLLSNERIIFLS